jgi:hypothetical protein
LESISIDKIPEDVSINKKDNFDDSLEKVPVETKDLRQSFSRSKDMGISESKKVLNLVDEVEVVEEKSVNDQDATVNRNGNKDAAATTFSDFSDVSLDDESTVEISVRRLIETARETTGETTGETTAETTIETSFKETPEKDIPIIEVEPKKEVIIESSLQVVDSNNEDTTQNIPQNIPRNIPQEVAVIGPITVVLDKNVITTIDSHERDVLNIPEIAVNEATIISPDKNITNENQVTGSSVTESQIIVIDIEQKDALNVPELIKGVAMIESDPVLPITSGVTEKGKKSKGKSKGKAKANSNNNPTPNLNPNSVPFVPVILAVETKKVETKGLIESERVLNSADEVIQPDTIIEKELKETFIEKVMEKEKDEVKDNSNPNLREEKESIGSIIGAVSEDNHTIVAATEVLSGSGSGLGLGLDSEGIDIKDDDTETVESCRITYEKLLEELQKKHDEEIMKHKENLKTQRDCFDESFAHLKIEKEAEIIAEKTLADFYALAQVTNSNLNTYPNLSTYPNLNTYPNLSTYPNLNPYPNLNHYPNLDPYPFCPGSG